MFKKGMNPFAKGGKKEDEGREEKGKRKKSKRMMKRMKGGRK
jgi:hypothetical protein